VDHLSGCPTVYFGKNDHLGCIHDIIKPYPPVTAANLMNDMDRHSSGLPVLVK